MIETQKILSVYVIINITFIEVLLSTRPVKEINESGEIKSLRSTHIDTLSIEIWWKCSYINITRTVLV